jgi:hypothetical protein
MLLTGHKSEFFSCFPGSGLQKGLLRIAYCHGLTAACQLFDLQSL